MGSGVSVVKSDINILSPTNEIQGSSSLQARRNSLLTKQSKSNFFIKTESVKRALDKFLELDKDGSGVLDMKEIMELTEWMLNNYHLGPLSEDEINASKASIIRVFDGNKDKKIGFYEFHQLYEEVYVRIKLVESCQSKFQELDADSSGFIEMDELVLLTNWVLRSYEELGCDALTVGCINDALLKKFDGNKDGKLSQYEFSLLFEEVCGVQAMISKAKEKFKEIDKDGSGFISGDEIDDLAIFAFGTYHPNCKSIPEEEKKRLADKIKMRCDVKGDGRLYLQAVSPLLAEVLESRAIMEAGAAKFKEMDTDSSGFLSGAEIGDVIGAHITSYSYYSITECIDWVINTYCLLESADDVKSRVLQTVDENGDGKLNLDEFIALFAKVISKSKIIGKARQIFMELDKNFDGVLRGEELRTMVRWILSFYEPDGELMSLDQRDLYQVDLMMIIDKDKDGKVNLDEFVEMFEVITKRRDKERKTKGSLIQ